MNNLFFIYLTIKKTLSLRIYVVACAQPTTKSSSGGVLVFFSQVMFQSRRASSDSGKKKNNKLCTNTGPRALSVTRFKRPTRHSNGFISDNGRHSIWSVVVMVTIRAVSCPRIRLALADTRCTAEPFVESVRNASKQRTRDYPTHVHCSRGSMSWPGEVSGFRP